MHSLAFLASGWSLQQFQWQRVRTQGLLIGRGQARSLGRDGTQGMIGSATAAYCLGCSCVSCSCLAWCVVSQLDTLQRQRAHASGAGQSCKRVSRGCGWVGGVQVCHVLQAVGWYSFKHVGPATKRGVHPASIPAQQVKVYQSCKRVSRALVPNVQAYVVSAC